MYMSARSFLSVVAVFVSGRLPAQPLEPLRRSGGCRAFVHCERAEV